jgi:hypothetical protein
MSPVHRIALVALLCAGCGPWAWAPPPILLQAPPPPTIASFAVPWANVDVHPADPSALPAGEAVVLFHEEGLRHVVDPMARSVVSRRWFRNVTYIRTEGGLKVADVVINVGSSDRLSSIRARTFKRDGRVVEMARNEVVQEKPRSQSGGSPIRRVIFALPDVAMGDTIEYAYEIEEDHPVLCGTFEVPSDIPVMRTSFWIATGRGFRLATRASAGLTLTTTLEGYDGMMLRIEGGPFVPTEEEPFAPGSEHVPPSFTFSVRDAQINGQNVPLIESWGDVLQIYLEAQDKYLRPRKGPPVKLPDDRAGQARALSEYARDRLIDAPPLGAGVLRDARQIEEQRGASARERVLYLRAQLGAVGAEARLVLVRDRRHGVLDGAVVDPDQVDAMLLYLPPFSAAETSGVYLDPTCASCAFGELPWWYQGVVAIVEAPGSMRTPGVWIGRTPVSAATTSKRRVRATVNLSTTGDAEVDLSITVDGVAAMALRDAVRDGGGGAATQREAGGNLIGGLCPRAQLRELAIFGLDTRSAPLEVRAKVRLAGLATPLGDRLLVPLSPCSRLPADPLASPVRQDPLELPFERQIDDETTLVLPAGYARLEVPAAVSIAAMGGHVESAAPTSADGGLVGRLQITLPRLTLEANRVRELRPLFAAYFKASNAIAIVGREPTITTGAAVARKGARGAKAPVKPPEK